MRRELSYTASVLAATTAFAAPSVAKAETAPSPSRVDQTLQRDYSKLKTVAEKLAHREKLNHASSIVIKNTPTIIEVTGDNNVKGKAFFAQEDAFDKKTHTLQETDVTVLTPDNQGSTRTPLPGSLFEVILYQVKYNGASVPTTPAGYNRAIDKAATKDHQRVRQYDFNEGLVAPDDSWQVLSNNNLFTAAPNETPQQSVSLNFDVVKSLITQGSDVMNQAGHLKVVPEHTLASIVPTHPR